MRRRLLLLLLLQSFLCGNLEEAQSINKRTTLAASSGRRSTAACRDLILAKSDFDHGDHALRGISEIYVLTTPVQWPMLPPISTTVNVDHIKWCVEQHCRIKGLRIAHPPTSWNTPVLIVQLNNLYGINGQHVYVTAVELDAPAILAKDMKTRIFSKLYRFENLECVGDLTASQLEIEKHLLNAVDQFLVQWTQDNKKR